MHYLFGDKNRSIQILNDGILDSPVTTSSSIPSKVLSDEQIDRSIQYLVPYYQERTRDKFAFGFSGLTYKQSINEVRL
jgi:hypothetical protein